MMIIRNFKNKDIESIHAIYQEQFHDFPISKSSFIQQHINDINFDENLFYIAEEEGRIIGFLFGIIRKIPYQNRGLEEDKAWIKLMAVTTEFQNKGIGSELLRFFEENVQGRNIILAFYSPNYFFSGVQENHKNAIEFFKHHGYECGEESYWMERDLSNYEFPDEVKIKKIQLEKEGFSFIGYSEKYCYLLLKMIKENFSLSWANYVVDAIKQNRAEESIILCLHKDEVVGYVSRASIDYDESRFGPFGVAETYRDHKLGEVLIHCMFESMVNKEIYRVFFKSTEENGKRFYLRQKMEVKMIFYHMVKENLLD
ncbi:GNAT family N-acetyltransferase [Anaerorhabdus sp.]|uniref:GNAT family N-acetyltransferase n=1 Tax=Anaerorhabdus sp. TaxID=1872524 RepID=UPI002FC7F6FB